MGNTPDRATRAAKPATESATPDEPRPTILLVTDHQTDRDLYGGLLWYNGYEVAHAADGEDAVRKALDGSPDLVVLSVSGPDAGERLDIARRLRGEGVAVPFVVLSAVPEQEIASEAMDAGVSAILEKPLDPYVVVREALRWIGPARP